jgi:acetyl esterase/lipase
VLATVLALLVAAGAGAWAYLGGSGGSTPAIAGGASGGELAADTAGPTTTTPPEPDRLADPGVGPGECAVVTYTPPTASEPQEGELCRPATAQRDVVVVAVHGGGGTGGTWQGMRRWSDRLLAEGYVTFLPGYHLFTPGGERPVFPLPEQNLKAAVQYVRGTGNALGIDKQRVVVQGMSAGARIGAVAYTTPDDAWFAGPELHPGISDRVDGFVGFYHPYDGSMQHSTQYYGGSDESSDPAVVQRWGRADALANAGRAQGDALFVTGDEDWSLIADHQELFAAVLEATGHEARTVVVEGGGHGFDEGGERLSRLGEQAALEVLDWLNDTFPQRPARAASTADVDTRSAPAYTGQAGTTVPTRRNTGNGASSGTTSVPSPAASGRSTTPTTLATATTTATTVAPVTTTTPPTPPTTATPPTTTPPTVVTPPPTATTPAPEGEPAG